MSNSDRYKDALAKERSIEEALKEAKKERIAIGNEAFPEFIYKVYFNASGPEIIKFTKDYFHHTKCYYYSSGDIKLSPISIVEAIKMEDPIKVLKSEILNSVKVAEEYKSLAYKYDNKSKKENEKTKLLISLLKSIEE